MLNLNPTLLVVAFLLALAAFLCYHRTRIVEIFRAWDTDTAQAILIVIAYWQAWKFAIFLGWTSSPFNTMAWQFTDSHVNEAAAKISAALSEYWVTMLGPNLVLAFLGLFVAASANLYFLIKKHLAGQCVTVFLFQLWWIGAGLTFNFHTPAHDTGGFQFIAGGISLATCRYLWVKMGRAKGFTLIEWLLHKRTVAQNSQRQIKTDHSPLFTTRHKEAR